MSCKNRRSTENRPCSLPKIHKVHLRYDPLDDTSIAELLNFRSPNLMIMTSKLLANHLRQVTTGGNWTASNLQNHLDATTLEQAKSQIGSLNTILALSYHILYYVRAITPVMRGGSLDAHDKYSYDAPEISSEEEWQSMRQSIYDEIEDLAKLIEEYPDDQLDKFFELEKYGSYHRNFLGLIEHTHYHLGQIALIRKLLSEA